MFVSSENKLFEHGHLMKDEDYKVVLPAIDDLSTTKKRKKYSKFILFSALFALFLLLGGASAGVTIYLINNDLIGGSESSSTASPSRNGTENTSSPSTKTPSLNPTNQATNTPSRTPSKSPSFPPTFAPSAKSQNGVKSKNPTKTPSSSPSTAPTLIPTRFPSQSPVAGKTQQPTITTKVPTNSPTKTNSPTSRSPSQPQTNSPSATQNPTRSPSPASPTTSSPFTIRIINITTMSPEEEAGFILAKERWESIITAGYSTSITLMAGANPCNVGYYDQLVIEDLVIFAAIRNIDGSGGVLGQAGPCIISGNRVRAGIMIFDINDTPRLISLNKWRSTILHEMGHILGIGTRWDAFSVLDASYNYLGVNGNIGNSEIGGTGNALVEDTGGAGTIRAHWRESVYQDEIMTGYLTGTSQPMSRLTIRSLADLGYSVNPELADTYEIPIQQRRLEEDTKKKNNLRLINDVYEGPVEEIHVSQLQVKPGRENEWNQELAKFNRRTQTPTT